MNKLTGTISFLAISAVFLTGFVSSSYAMRPTDPASGNEWRYINIAVATNARVGTKFTMVFRVWGKNYEFSVKSSCTVGFNHACQRDVYLPTHYVFVGLR